MALPAKPNDFQVVKPLVEDRENSKNDQAKDNHPLDT